MNKALDLFPFGVVGPVFFFLAFFYIIIPGSISNEKVISEVKKCYSAKMAPEIIIIKNVITGEKYITEVLCLGKK